MGKVSVFWVKDAMCASTPGERGNSAIAHASLTLSDKSLESSVISSFFLWVMTHLVLQIPDGETSLPESLAPKGEEKDGTFSCWQSSVLVSADEGVIC